LHGGIGEAFSNAVTVGFVGDLFADLGQIVLAVGVVHVRQQLGAFMCQMHAATQEITGGAHLGGIDIRLREHTATEQGGNLLGIDFVIFGLTPMYGFHVEGVSEDKRDTCIGAQVGEPVPGEHTFDGDDDTVSIGCNGFEKGFRICLHVTVKQRLTGLVEDADVHGTGMQVDTAVKWVLRGVKSH
jgi:hypothetical protein